MPLTTEELEALARAPQSMSGDTGSLTERSADDLKKLIDLAAEAEITADASANGGPKSGLRFCRPARVAFGGAHR